MKKEDLIAKAKECLAFNKKEKEVIIAADGTCFLVGAAQHAKNHALQNGLKTFVFDGKALIGFVENKQGKKGVVVDFEEMTKAEIDTYAKEKGFELDKGTKAEMIAELTEKLAKSEA